jgi:hypothetical protein
MDEEDIGLTNDAMDSSQLAGHLRKDSMEASG